MAGRSRRKINVNSSVPESAKYLTSCYCRKCMQNRRSADFYDAADKLLDSNSKMSICRYCINDVFESYFVKDNNLNNAIYQTCKIINVRYDANAVETTQKHLDSVNSKGKAINQVFGVYLSKLKLSNFGQIDIENVDFTFSEPIRYDAPGIDPEIYGDDTVEELEKFWGKGFTPDQYQFLENKMDEYKKTHRSDTAAEVSLLRQICFTELDIREARNPDGGGSVGNHIKLLQDLMKTANIDPVKAAVANSGKSQDTFSSFVKIIEENEPADYYKDKELFKDFDNVSFYFD